MSVSLMPQEGQSEPEILLGSTELQQPIVIVNDEVIA
jgi:hypothetical protein